MRYDVAEAALAILAKTPDPTLKLIEQHLAPLLENKGRRISALIEELDDDRFDVRKHARQQLSAWGVLIEPELRRGLKSEEPKLEAKFQLKSLLSNIPESFAVSHDERRWVRLTRLLNTMEIPAAHAVHRALAPAAHLTIVDSRIPPLQDRLSSSSAEQRVGAAFGLAEFGETALPALPKLIALLSDNDSSVQVNNLTQSVGAHVENALVKFGPTAIGPLINTLTHQNPKVRTRAATVLGSAQDERGIEPLLKLLADAESEVCSAAGSALVKFGPKAVERIIPALSSNNSKVCGQAAYVLSQIGDRRAIEPLAGLLSHDDRIVREFAVDSVSKFGAAATASLIAALKSDNIHIKNDGKLRAKVVSILRKHQNPNIIAPLVAALTDEHEEVRNAAVYCLAFQPPEAISVSRRTELLIAAMSDKSGMVRRSAISALGNLAHHDIEIDMNRVIEQLMKALDDPLEDVQQSAIQSLGHWRATKAVDRLLRCLKQDQLRAHAAAALGQIGDPRAIVHLRTHLAGKESPVIRALGQLKDRESIDSIIALLKDDDTQIRDASIEALGAIRDRRAVEPLIAMLDVDDQLLGRLAQALGEIKDPRAVQPLIEASRKRLEPIQFGGLEFPAAADPLNNPIGWPLIRLGLPAVEPLAKVLNSPSTKLREVAACVLYNLAGQGGLDTEDMRPAVDPLVAALNDSTTSVSRYAALTLGKLKDPRAIDKLIDVIAAENSSYQRFNAANYLGSMRDPKSYQPLLDLLQSERSETRAAAATGLGLLKDNHAVKPLVAALNDTDSTVRAAAARALANLKASTAVEPLISLLTDKVPSVRSQAAASLGRLGDHGASDALASAGEDKDFAVQIAAGIALVRLDDARGVPIVARCLNHPSSKMREQAVTDITISFINKESLVPPLVAALSDPSIRVRLYAALSLGRIGTAPAVEALLKKVSDRENLRSVLQGLAETKDDRAVKSLIDHLDDPDAAYRIVAAFEIGNIKDERHTEHLVRHLTDPSSEVRLSIIQALTILNSKRAIDPLTAALQDEDPQVRIYAARGVKRIQR